MIYKGKGLTYRELDERVNRLASAMIAWGVKKGDKVATYLKNSQEIIEIYFATAKAGAITVPVNFRLVPREIAFILSNSESKLLFFDLEFCPNIESSKNEITGVEKYIAVANPPGGTYTNYEDFLSTGSPSNLEVQLEDDDEAFILYTAGTTGRPKGAVLSHKNLIINAMTMALEHGISFEDRHLCVPPLFHSAALCCTLMFMTVIGTTIVMRDFDPHDVLKTIEKEKITLVFLVPAMWIFLLSLPEVKEYNTSTLRFAFTGGAIMPVSVKREVMSRFPNAGVIDTFGQTEMSPCATTLKARDALRKEGSVGLPLPNVEARVVDEQMDDVPVGEVGEIVYRGPARLKATTIIPLKRKKPFGEAGSTAATWYGRTTRVLSMS